MNKCYLILILFFVLGSCTTSPVLEDENLLESYDHVEPIVIRTFDTLTVEEDIQVKTYFEYLEQVVACHQEKHEYFLTEHLIVHANPWILDRLIATDYYLAKEKGKSIDDQPAEVILQKGDKIILPDSILAITLMEALNTYWLDINIPEFKLRIFQGDSLLFTFPIRVGQKRKRYLAMIDRKEDLRTKTGEGMIIKVNKNPTYRNPVDNKKYSSTKRDDGHRTKLPRIPWLTPELDGHQWGQLIHPTTNEETLEKAYSNGCIGTSEKAAWIIYYYAPIGTPISVRYELYNRLDVMDSSVFKDIYNLYQ